MLDAKNTENKFSHNGTDDAGDQNSKYGNCLNTAQFNTQLHADRRCNGFRHETGDDGRLHLYKPGTPQRGYQSDSNSADDPYHDRNKIVFQKPLIYQR